MIGKRKPLPQPAEEPQPPRDMRPRVSGATSNRGIWIFAGCLALGGGGLFALLEGHRAPPPGAALTATVNDINAPIAAPPPLSVPPDPNGGFGAPAPVAIPIQPDVAPLRPVMPRPVPAALSIRTPQVASDFETRLPMGHTLPPPTPQPARARGRLGEDGPADEGKGGERVQASRFANPSTTVPKGTVIQAVLETALDSTRAGYARAIVSRDIYSFDGSRVLIARGSRLIGEYKSDLTSGQNRALVQWQRLMRPDGVTINLDSPAADPLGRAGIKGKVHSHFVAQFGGSILQSALNVGQQVAVNELTAGAGTTVLAIPSSGQSSQASLTQNKSVPSLTIQQGTSVSVFVARDLDFTMVER